MAEIINEIPDELDVKGEELEVELDPEVEPELELELELELDPELEPELELEVEVEPAPYSGLESEEETFLPSEYPF